MSRLVHRQLRLLAAVTAPLALVAGALGPGPASAASSALRARSAAVPTLVWKSCDLDFQCSTATVPLDYAHPSGPTISIALKRLPATDRAHRIGSLFINPGGPGGSGVDFVQAASYVYSDQVRARFDIVGFDPRFVGSSRPLATCATDEEYDALFDGLVPFPVTAAQEHQTHQAYLSYDTLCAQRSPFLAYAATANVARDLDLLRQAVGDRQLSYAGYSYGSVLGQTYAALFPAKVRSLTIDGVIDAREWSTGRHHRDPQVPYTARIESASGSYDTFKQFTTFCDKAGPDRCAFTADGKARTKFQQLANRLRAEPFPLPDDPDAVLDYPSLVSATVSVLYDPQEWGWFAEQLEQVYEYVFTNGERRAARSTGPAAGEALIQRARAARWAPPGRDAGQKTLDADEDFPPIDAGTAAFSAVTCSDSVNPHSESAWTAAGAEQDRRAPYFGRLWTWNGEACASWQLPGIGRYLGPYNTTTSAPVLVVGNLYDPATPYGGARAVAGLIPGARLLGIDGYGHTSFAAPSACAGAVFDAYLIAGTLPARGAVCGQDIAPFAPL
jgi:pimeloyl-ACP methyl ester carboxylesterase